MTAATTGIILAGLSVFRASFDGGETLTPSVPVSEIPYRPQRTDPIPLMSGHESRQPNAARRALVPLQRGTHGGPGGIDRRLWVRNSTGVPQLWPPRSRLPGFPKRTFSRPGRIDRRQQQSGAVFTNLRLVRSTKMVEADLQLENLRAQTLHGPLKLRVLDLTSDLVAVI
jgi:hypothetical protein